jgi:hypothetical protein
VLKVGELVQSPILHLLIDGPSFSGLFFHRHRLVQLVFGIYRY